MPKTSLVGASYVYPSLAFDAQRSVNWYPVKSESGTSRDEFALFPTAGLKLFSSLSNYEVRGSWAVLGRAFFVAGNELYEVFDNGTNLVLGTITTSYTSQVSISDNGGQLCIVDGTLTGGWILDLSTNVFTQIIDPYFLGAVHVVFLGGYFVFNRPASSVYYISTIYDGLTGDATEFAVAEGSPDSLTGLIVLQNQCYLVGGVTTEVIYNSGDVDFPLAPISGAFAEFGSLSPFSFATSPESLFFIGNSKVGSNIVLMVSGYQPKKISTTAIEKVLDQHDMTKATGYVYQEQGHFFYVLTAPTMQTTFVYDIGLDQWHEKCYFNPASGVYSKHRGKFHLYALNKHLIGDYENGNIYQQSLDLPDDDGVAIRRQRTLPYIINELEYIYFKSFQIDMEVGTGLEVGAIEDTDPHIFLEWSDDNANTFTNGMVGAIGKLGEFLTRVSWRRLGRGRTRVFRLTTSTRAKCFLVAAHVLVDKGGS